MLLTLVAITAHAAGEKSVPWKQLTNDKAFGYRSEVESILPDKTRATDYNIIQKIVNALFSLFGNSTLSRILVWLIIISAFTFVVYKLFVGNNSVLSARKKKLEAGEQTGENEAIEANNWEELMQQASRNNDARLAVRYSYMWLLQMLQQKNLIQYSADKTNYEYYRELAETSYRQPFKSLSRQYEYTWYGKYELSQTAYNDYLDQFHHLKKQLGS